MIGERVDVAIVGAGTAGLAALREVRKRTKGFLLINDGPMGTACARVGCMPSKVVIAATNAFHARTKLATFAIVDSEKLAADVPAVMRRVLPWVRSEDMSPFQVVAPVKGTVRHEVERFTEGLRQTSNSTDEGRPPI